MEKVEGDGGWRMAEVNTEKTMKKAPAKLLSQGLYSSVLPPSYFAWP